MSRSVPSDLPGLQVLDHGDELPQLVLLVPDGLLKIPAEGIVGIVKVGTLG